MIIHSIEKYKEKFSRYIPSFISPPDDEWRMGKLAYAMYLSKLPYKVGDYVTSKYSNPPLLKREIYKVVNIDEIHRFVTFGHPDIGPLCLTLENAWGQTLSGRQGSNIYRKVEFSEFPQDMLPLDMPK